MIGHLLNKKKKLLAYETELSLQKKLPDLNFCETTHYSDSGLLVFCNKNLTVDQKFLDEDFIQRYKLISSETIENLLNKIQAAFKLNEASFSELSGFYETDEKNTFFARGWRFFFRLVKFSWVHTWRNNFFIVKHLPYEKGGKNFFSRFTLIKFALKDLQIKKIAQHLEEMKVGFILVDFQLSTLKRFALLASALHAGIPILFLSKRENNWHALKDKIETAAHQSLRKRRAVTIKSISEIYGAKDILAEYCKLSSAEFTIPGFWMHGWIPSFHNVHPAFIALHKRERPRFRWSSDPFNKTDLQLVVRADQKDFLLAHGYTQVEAIGHPIIYLTPTKLPRIKNSLLVVPPHGGGYRTEDDELVKKYVDYISAFKEKFSHIQLCVTVEDYVKKNWWTAFQKAGIKNIVSVDRSHPKALQRLIQILSQFEYVTTNGFGSIVAYAAFAGCKVSVAGPYAELPRQLLKQAHAVLHFPELETQQVEICSEGAFKRHYPELFTAPDLAIERISWGGFELGFQHKLTLQQMNTLLQRK